MQIFLLILVLIFGLFILIFGADYVVKSCSKISALTGINEILIGALVLSFATTIPENTISILASFQGAFGIVLGEGFGTILVNTCLILGLMLSFVELKSLSQQNINKILFFAFLVAFISIFASLNLLNVYLGIILIIFFIAYLIYCVKEAKSDLLKKIKSENKNIINSTRQKDKILTSTNFQFSNENNLSSIKSIETIENKYLTSKKTLTKSQQIQIVLKFIVGLLLIFAGSQILISATENLSSALNINSQVLALTLISVGTSLPELSTSIISIKRRRINLSIGNIIGANIIVLTLLFGIACIISGTTSIVQSSESLISTIPVLSVATCVVVLPILFKNRTFKWQGYALLSLYVVHIISLFFIF